MTGVSSTSGVGSTAGTPGFRTAQRPRWDDLPVTVHAAVEARSGARVVAATTQEAGFTPGFASRLLLEDGRRLFLKGAGPAAEAWLLATYRREARQVAALPPHDALVPDLWSVDVDGWFLAAYEDVEGRHPGRPWQGAEAATVLGALADAARALTPVPDGTHAPTWATALAPCADGFDGLIPVLGPERCATARELALRVLREASPTTLCHDDVRDDNLLLEADGRVRLVDWSLPIAAPAWFMPVVAMIAVAGDGLDADALLAAHDATSQVPGDHIDGVIALHLGYYAGVAEQDHVPTSPWLRRHQRW